MDGIWRQVKAGWRDARWSFYYALALVPTVAIAFAVAYVIEGRVTTPPSALTWALCVPAALVSLFWAGLKDGLTGRLGRYVWTFTLLLLGYWLLLILIRTHGTEKQKSIKAGRDRVTLFVALRPSSPESSQRAVFPPADIHWAPG